MGGDSWAEFCGMLIRRLFIFEASIVDSIFPF